jgi:hypothetical protein
MTLDDFNALLDRCGADPAHWPAGAEGAAGRLLATSEPARAAHAALAAAEAALAMTKAQDVGARDFAALAMASPQIPHPLSWAAWRRNLSLAVAASFVLSVGVVTGAWRPRTDDPSQVLSAALFANGESNDVE